MENQFRIAIEAVLEKSGLQKELLEVQKLFKNKSVNITTKLETSSTINEVKKLSSELTTELNKIGLNVSVKDVNSALVSSLRESQRELVKTQAETDRLTDKINRLVSTKQLQKQVGGVSKSYDGLLKSDISKSLSSDYGRLVELSDKLNSSISNKEKLSVWKEMQTLLPSVKNELSSITSESTKIASTDKRIGLSNEIKNWASNNSKALRYCQKDLDKFIATLNSSDEMSISSLKNIEMQFKGLQTQMRETGRLGSSFGQSIKDQASKFGQWVTVSGVIMGAVGAVKKMKDKVYELDNQLLELSKVSDLSAEGLKNVTKEAYNLGDTVAKTGTNVLSAITNFKRAGYELKQSMDFAEDSLVMVNVSENIRDAGVAAKYLISIMKGYQDSSSEFSQKILDSVNQVSNTQAVDFDNLVDGAQNLSAVANQANVSFDQMLGLLTGGYEVLGDMSKVSNGLITIFSRLQAIQLDGEEGVETVAKLQDKFSSATKGVVNIVDQTTGQLRGAFDIMSDLAGIWDTLDNNTQSALATDAAGIRQKNTFLSVIGNWEAVQKSVESATNSMGSAAEENDKYLNSIAGKTEAFNSQFEKLSQTVINSDDIKSIITLGTDGLKLLTDLISGLGGITPIIITVTSLMVAKKIAMGALIAYTEKQTLANLKLAVSEKGLSKSLNLIIASIKKLTLNNPIAWIIAIGGAIATTISLIDKSTVSLKEQEEKTKASAQAYQESIDKIQSLNSELETTKNRIDELNSKDTLTLTEQSELDKLKNQNSELERRIFLEQQASDIKAKALGIEASNLYNKTYGSVESVGYDKSAVSEYTKQLNEEINSNKATIGVGNNGLIDTTELTDINKEIALYQLLSEKVDGYKVELDKLNKIKQETGILTKEQQRQLVLTGAKYEQYSTKLELVDSIMAKNASSAQEQLTNLEAIPKTLRTDQQEIQIKNLTSLIEGYRITIDKTFEAQKKLDKFNELDKSGEITKAKEELISLAKDGVLSEQTVYSKFAWILDATGMSASELVNHIKELATAQNNTTSSTDVISGYIENLNTVFKDSVDSISAYKSALDKINLNNLTSEDVTELISKYPELSKYVDGASDSFDSLKRHLENAINDKTKNQISELHIELENLVKTNANPEQISYVKALIRIKEESLKVKDSLDALSSTDHLSSLADDLSKLGNAYKEFKDDKFVTSSTLSGLDAFKDLESFENFTKVAGNVKSSTKDIQNSFNQLVREYLNNENALAKLTDANKDYYITQLKQMGIVNASEVVMSALSSKYGTLADAQSNCAKSGQELVDITADEIQQLINSKTVSEIAAQGIAAYAIQKQFANNNPLNTDAEVKQLATLAQMAGIATDSLLSYNKAKNDYGLSAPAALKDSLNASKNTILDQIKDSIANVGTNVKFDTGYKPKDKKTKDDSQVIDWISRKLEILGKQVDVLKTKFTQIYSTFKNQNKEIDKSIVKLKNQAKIADLSYHNYIATANKVGLSKDLINKVQNGAMDITKYSGKTADKIQEYQKWYDLAQDCLKTITDLKIQEKELAKQKLDNIIDDYSNKNSYNKSLIDLRTAKIGDNGKNSDYQYLINKNNVTKKNLNDEIKLLEKELSSMLANKTIAKGTDAWIKYQKQIVDLRNELVDCNEAIVEATDNATKLRFKGIEDEIAKLDKLQDKINHVQGLLSGDNYDEKGNLTDVGLTNSYFNLQGIANAKNQIADYQQAIAELNKNKKNLSKEEYDNALSEYTSGLEESQNDLKNYRDSMIDLTKQGIQAQTEAMRELVQSKKEALDAEIALHNYQNKIADKNKNLANLDKKIVELSKSQETADIALRLKLENDRAELKKEIDEDEYNRSMDLKKQGLDDELKAYEKTQSDKEKELDSSLDAQERAIDNSLKVVKSKHDVIYNQINTIAKTYGTSIKDNLVSPTTKALDDLEKRLQGLGNTKFNISSAPITTTTNKTQSTSSSTTSKTPSTTTNNTQSNTSNSSTSKKLPIPANNSLKGNSKLNKDTSVNDRLAYLGYDNSKSSKSSLWKYFGLSGTYSGTASQNTKLLEQLKKSGFNDGGIVDLLKQTGEHGFGLLKRGEAVLSIDDTKSLKEFVDIAPVLQDFLKISTPKFDNLKNSEQIGGSVELNSPLLVINGSIDDKKYKELQKQIEQVPQRIVSEMRKK